MEAFAAQMETQIITGTPRFPRKHSLRRLAAFWILHDEASGLIES